MEDLLAERMFYNAFFPVMISLFERFEQIISVLNQRSLDDRRFKELRMINGKEVNYYGFRELTIEQMANEIKGFPLEKVIEFVKNTLAGNPKPTIANNELLSLYNTAYQDKQYIEALLNDKEKFDAQDRITMLSIALKQSLDFGYGHPEKFNNIFRFLADKALETIKLMGL
jgi:hypothetical protein